MEKLLGKSDFSEKADLAQIGLARSEASSGDLDQPLVECRLIES